MKIGHYWAGYDKSKSKNNFKESSLIEAARFCRQSSTVDFSDGYKLFLNSILKLLRLAKKRDDSDRRYTASSMQSFLKASGNWGPFRKTIYSLLSGTQTLNQDGWENICNALASYFNLQDLNDEAQQYLTYTEEIIKTENQDEENEANENVSLNHLPQNTVKHPDGFHIQLSTIHSVKGETHDATLIMETKNHCYDLEVMLPYLVGDLPNDQHPNEKIPEKPNHRRSFKPNKVFMRQLYVAASRSSHLLCLAIHEDRIEEAQKAVLMTLGWNFLYAGKGVANG